MSEFINENAVDLQKDALRKASNEEQEQMRYTKSPLSEKETETKLDEIRNIAARKMDSWANKITVSMAFTPTVKRVEGEKWTEGNRTYIIKNGTKQNFSITQEARMPWWCPKCEVSMSHRFDRKFYFLRGWCFNCNVEWEGQLRLNGDWEAFEKRMLRENEKSFLRDRISESLEYIRTFKVPQLHFGDGRWEQIGDITHYQGEFDRIQKDVDFLYERLEAIQLEEEAEANGQSEANTAEGVAEQNA